jgi:hypothetical protein
LLVPLPSSVQRRTEQHSATSHSTAQRSAAQRCTAQPSSALLSAAPYSLAQRCSAQPGSAPHRSAPYVTATATCARPARTRSRRSRGAIAPLSPVLAASQRTAAVPARPAAGCRRSCVCSTAYLPSAGQAGAGRRCTVSGAHDRPRRAAARHPGPAASVPAHRAEPQGLRRPHRAAAGAGKHRGGAPSSTLSAAQLHAARCSASKPQDPPTHTRASARTTPGGNATRARRRGLESSLRNRTLTRRAAFTTGMPRSRFRNASCPPRRMSYHPPPTVLKRLQQWWWRWPKGGRTGAVIRSGALPSHRSRHRRDLSASCHNFTISQVCIPA